MALQETQAEVVATPDVVPSIRQEVIRILKDFLPPINQPRYYLRNFEYASPIGEDQRRELVDRMVELPNKQGNELFRAAPDLRFISDNQARFPALECMYQGPADIWARKDPWMYLWSHLFIGNIHNAMAIRNRKREVVWKINSFLRGQLEKTPIDQKVEVLSVAGGSGRAVTEATILQTTENVARVHATIVDQDPRAPVYAGDLATKCGLPNGPKVILANIGRLVIAASQGRDNSYLPPGYKAHFVEIVGLLDYFGDKTLVELLKWARTIIHPGGEILISNMDDKDVPGENRFREEVVGWQKMYLRSSDHLMTLAETLPGVQVAYIREPLGVYNFVHIVCN